MISVRSAVHEHSIVAVLWIDSTEYTMQRIEFGGQGLLYCRTGIGWIESIPGLIGVLGVGHHLGNKLCCHVRCRAIFFYSRCLFGIALDSFLGCKSPILLCRLLSLGEENQQLQQGSIFKSKPSSTPRLRRRINLYSSPRLFNNPSTYMILSAILKSQSPLAP